MKQIGSSTWNKRKLCTRTIRLAKQLIEKLSLAADDMKQKRFFQIC